VLFNNVKLKNLLPVITREKSVLIHEEGIFLILRVDTNILHQVWPTDEKVLFQLWAGRGASIVAHKNVDTLLNIT
jgi:hypothetical protein